MRSSAVISGVLALTLLVLVAVGWPPLLSFDRSIAEALHRSALAHPGFTRVNRVLTDWVWDPWTMRALAAVATVVLWWRRERRAALWVAGTSLLAVGSQQTLKAVVGRERPHWAEPVDWARYAAFPSGHAMTATVTCGLLLWVLALHWRDGWRGWGTLAGAAVVSVLGVGWTRVYLGVHWPSDVVEGWLLGWCWVATAVLTYRWSERRGAARPSPGDDGDGAGSNGSRMGEGR
ncbi:phosphatase PAP2 family protein [Streptomyces litmocidini]|uniref:phosphatase PAP2 family protein n=1 Tax=Streptomyces litmocidini TaxID=67318 RepID=UPI00167F090C|nr:phosphatase PAP2 family protein [Streptomyces litmocidini]GGV00631.1 phosphatase PAP2 family protein [Streptomyces litmocidini]